MNQFSRTELLLGPAAMARLAAAHVAVFGIGGVGGHAAEALVRSGVGHLTLVDHDTISTTNLNRQIFALHTTLEMPKVEAARQRLLDINPALDLYVVRGFYTTETAGEFPLAHYDYVVDAVDTVTAKLLLAQNAQAAGVPVISSMGTGNKLDPTALQVADIYETSVCPLARIMRKECRKRGIAHLKCVYSREEPLAPAGTPEELPPEGRRQIPGSSAFVPAAAGLILAAEVIRDLTQACSPA